MADAVTKPEDLNAATWGLCDDLDVYRQFFDRRAAWPRRKLRLLMAGAARAAWDNIAEPHCRAAVEAVEQYARDADPDRLAAAYRDCEQAARATPGAMSGAGLVAYMATRPDRPKQPGIDWCMPLSLLWPPDPRFFGGPILGRTLRSGPVYALHLALFRDIVPNPFDPVAVEPAWRTRDVVGLCEAMVAAGDFAAMPVLADALQDAGCDDERILGHCRADRPHARGCWVLDALLGFEAFPDGVGSEPRA